MRNSRLTPIIAILIAALLGGGSYALYRLWSASARMDRIAIEAAKVSAESLSGLEPWNGPWKNAIEPKFALEMMRKQVEFGPRIPGSAAHLAARDWLVQRFKELGGKQLEIEVQAFEAPIGALVGRPPRASFNIWARFFPERKRRVLLAAHWDTRERSDKDSSNPNGTLDGAIDGASGVALTMELSRGLMRILSARPSADAAGTTAGAAREAMGWDVLLFDAEDQGLTGGEPGVPYDADLITSWCLGSQYWLSSPLRSQTKAEFGILFDMVGAEGAQFPQEAHSLLYAKPWADLIWGKAQALRYGDIFISDRGPAITDDHVYVNRGGIPMVDIIDMRPESGRQAGGDWFGPYHHRRKDSMKIADSLVLQAVGETVISVIEDWSK